MTTTAANLETKQPATAEKSPEQELLERSTGIRSWDKFVARSKDIKSEPKAEQGPEYETIETPHSVGYAAKEGSKNPLPDLSKKQLENWRETGELPKQKAEAGDAGLSKDGKPGEAAEPGDNEATEGKTEKRPEDPQEFQVWHNKNVADLQESYLRDADVKTGLENIHLDAERGEWVLHALADTPKNVRKLVIQHLASRPDAQQAMNARNPETGDYLFSNEHLVMAVQMLGEELPKLHKAQARQKAPPETRAPKPPAEIGGRGTAPSDTARDAAARGDFRTAKAEWNRRAKEGRTR